MKNLLIAGNTITPNSVGIFNLPPLKTCTPSKWCKKHCYALFGRHTWSNVRSGQEWRYKQSLRQDFVDKMVQEIKRRKSLKVIRIHLAGDFYSKKYIDKWIEIAIQLPDYIFRVNTKRLDFLKYLKKNSPRNLVIRESTDISRKGKGLFPQAAVEGTKGSKRFFWCIDDCEKCNYHCFYSPKINVVFKQLR